MQVQAGEGRLEGEALGWVRMNGWFSGLAVKPGALLLRRRHGPASWVRAGLGRTDRAR